MAPPRGSARGLGTLRADFYGPPFNFGSQDNDGQNTLANPFRGDRCARDKPGL